MVKVHSDKEIKSMQLKILFSRKKDKDFSSIILEIAMLLDIVKCVFCVATISGFVGVYMAGHILESTKSWSAVFNQTAVVCVFGCIVFTLFGTGKQIV